MKTPEWVEWFSSSVRSQLNFSLCQQYSPAPALSLDSHVQERCSRRKVGAYPSHGVAFQD